MVKTPPSALISSPLGHVCALLTPHQPGDHDHHHPDNRHYHENQDNHDYQDHDVCALSALHQPGDRDIDDNETDHEHFHPDTHNYREFKMIMVILMNLMDWMMMDDVAMTFPPHA